MVYFGETYFELPLEVDKNNKRTPYGDSVKLELLDGWRIRLEMSECDPEHDCTDRCMYNSRDISKKDLEDLKVGIDRLLKELKE